MTMATRVTFQTLAGSFYYKTQLFIWDLTGPEGGFVTAGAKTPPSEYVTTTMF